MGAQAFTPPWIVIGILPPGGAGGGRAHKILGDGFHTYTLGVTILISVGTPANHPFSQELGLMARC